VVDLLLMVATWASPVLYGWTQVRSALGSTFAFVYQMNPLTIAVEVFHYAFWLPTTDGYVELPPNLLTIWLPAGLVVALLIVVAGQLTFRRLEGRFAQEL
jgi:ABC-2 type transport system permease protein